jgi:hypothetical protein
MPHNVPRKLAPKLFGFPSYIAAQQLQQQQWLPAHQQLGLELQLHWHLLAAH